eukprot:scaffold918_cov126-Cylindrotheca_fusiformis.AAC.87
MTTASPPSNTTTNGENRPTMVLSNPGFDERYYSAEVISDDDDDLLDDSPLLSDSTRKHRTLNLKSTLGSKRDMLRESFKKVSLGHVRRSIGSSSRKLMPRRSKSVARDAPLNFSMSSQERDNSTKSVLSEHSSPTESTCLDGDLHTYPASEEMGRGFEQFEPSLDFSIRSEQSSTGGRNSSHLPLNNSQSERTRRISCEELLAPSCLDISTRSESAANSLEDMLAVKEQSVPRTTKRSKSKRSSSRRKESSKTSSSSKSGTSAGDSKKRKKKKDKRSDDKCELHQHQQ